MLIVGIETSGLCGSVALRRDGQCLAARSLEREGRRHAQTLLLELGQLLSSHQLTPRDVEAIAVSRGPGSFTGLRVGLVCAKTFAYATGCRFVAVDTFSVIAANCPPDVSAVFVIEDAQRGDLFVARYRRTDGNHWLPDSTFEIVPAEDWLAQRTASEVVTGRGLLRADLSAIKAHCLSADEFVQPKADFVALLGEQMLSNPAAWPESAFDPWTATPLYIRKSAAEEKRDGHPAAGSP